MIHTCKKCGNDFLTEADSYVVEPTPNGELYCSCQIVPPDTNAYLISAAPKMLAVLKHCEHILLEYGEYGIPDEIEDKTLVIIRAAIAKAEGKQKDKQKDKQRSYTTKLCTECVHAKTQSGEKITFENPNGTKIVLFNECYLHKDNEELNTQTQQLCNDWASEEWDEEDQMDDENLLDEFFRESYES